MNCAFHGQNIAVVNCNGCGKPLCPSCDHRVKGFPFCQECIVSGVELLRNRTQSAYVSIIKRQTTEAKAVRASWSSQAAEWIRGLSFPISIPQFAPVAMIMLFAFLIFNQTVSADGSISGMYQKSFELAGQTYQQGTNIMLGNPPIEQKSFSEPVSGTFVNSEGK